jgi:hypothetical protein
MRRYAVRILVALLTFGLGVALSLVFGFFKPRQVFVSDVTWSRRPPCRKQFQVARPEFVTTDTQLSDPLKLVYLGETSDGRMRFLIENRRDQTILGYSIRGDRIWGSDGQPGLTLFEWHSGDLLGPGETRSIITAPRTADAVSLRVSTVTFQSGFTWINPRDTR